jgi:glutamine amidotransferase
MMGSKSIVIVDYGMGNLHSVNKAVALVGGDPVITGDKAVIAGAEKMILPGVGAFGDCMANLEKAGVIPAIKAHISEGKPFLGICLGMQVLFEESEEAPGVTGLGVFPGKVVLIPTSLKIPHMGWNQLQLKSFSPLLAGSDGEYVYFVHSYCCRPEDENVITAVCDYGTEVVAAVGRANVSGFQYHPEKSSTVGLEMLKRFVEL